MDDTIDPTCTPFSGPRGDYAGAARKVEYASAQRAVYTGYKKLHSIKMETVFLPKGSTTLFGLGSARRSDPWVEAMSNVNVFVSTYSGIYLYAQLDEYIVVRLMMVHFYWTMNVFNRIIDRLVMRFRSPKDIGA